MVLLDNSPDSSEALRVAADASGSQYIYVPKPGFTEVRNAALEAARNHDFLIFIDDDECPDPSWLRHLIDAVLRYDADVILGPVTVQLPDPAPRWIREDLLRRPVVRPDGYFDGPVYSGNVLLRMSLVNRYQLEFDVKFNRLGGEDSDFFARLRSHGARVAWASQAIAREVPDSDRLTLRIILKRAYRAGYLAWIQESAMSTRRQLAQIMTRRILRIPRGILRIANAFPVLNLPEAIRGLQDLAFASGSIGSAVSMVRQADPR